MNLQTIIDSRNAKLLLAFGMGFLCLTIQEGLVRGGPGGAFDWFLTSPQLALVNLAVIFSVMALFAAVIGRITPAVLLSFLLLLFAALINYEKITRLQQPFFAWDLLYFKHIFVLLPAISIPYIPRSALHPLGAALFIFFCVLIHRERPLRVRSRIGLFLLPCMFLSLLVYHREIPRDIPSLLATKNEVWDQRSNYTTNGFLLAFLLNVQPILISEPENYCEVAIQDLLEDVVSDEYQAQVQKSERPISLVLFVSESFYDLMHVKYEADEEVLPNFRRLQSSFPSFRMISPSFGGNTSNVEFELLTGMSMAFLPYGAVPYDHCIKTEIPSLAGILKNSGYRTVAVHPYHAWFWNRKNVFSLMGFEEFIALDQFNGAKHRGWFVSDEALVDRMIEKIDGLGENPYFLYALSMQNHGEYDPRRYAPDEVEVRADIPEKMRLKLQTFVTGLRDADRELSRLLEYMESRPEPIVTLFCGDHLPSFGPDYALYRESGAIQSESGAHTLEDAFRMASVPCLLWANREGLLDADSVPEHLSPVYIPPLLLKQLGVEMPHHLRYLSKGIDEYPVIHRKFLWNPEGELLDFPSEKENHPFLKGLEMTQYDILFGERHSLLRPEKTTTVVEAESDEVEGDAVIEDEEHLDT